MQHTAMSLGRSAGANAVFAIIVSSWFGCSSDDATPATTAVEQTPSAGTAATPPASGAGAPSAGSGAGGSPARPAASGTGGAGAGDSGGTTPDASSEPQPSAAEDAGAQPVAGAGGSDAMTPDAEPTEPAGPWQWPVGKPEDFGMDSATIESAAESIQRSTGNRYGIVVVRKGTLVYEKYWDGTADDKHIIYSCTKSWGSSLIGIAVTNGLLNVADPVTKWVPMPVDGISDGATLEHVLTQSAHTNPPGRSFQYNSGYLLNTAPEILAAAAGVTPHQFYQEQLVKPLGLSMTWPPCPAGGCSGTRYKEGFIQFGNQPPEAPNAELPQSTVRDQAKLGWLWANGGKWGDKQLISPEYIAAGSKPGPGFRATYGYLIWVDSDDQFSAIGGVGNCYVHVMPSKQLVIAVMGGDAGLGAGGDWPAFRGLVDSIQD